jgi:hypothetical protein
MGDPKRHMQGELDSILSTRFVKRQLFVTRLWLYGLALLLPTVGLIVIFLYCNSLSANVMQTFGPSAMVAGAALIAGSFLGFLFAIPRAQQQVERIDGRSVAEQADGPLRINTNLEQVSDWLTKIIIGVTLIELGRIVRSLGPLIAALAVIYGNATGARVMAAGILVYFPIVGFLAGYVATRTLVAVVFDIVPYALSNLEQEERDRRPDQVAANTKSALEPAVQGISEGDVHAVPIGQAGPLIGEDRSARGVRDQTGPEPG